MTRLAGIEFAVPAFVAIPAVLGALALVSLVAGRLAARLARRWLHLAPPADGTPDVQTDRQAPHVTVPVTVAVFATGLLLLAPEFPLLRVGRLRAALTVILVGTCALALTRVAVGGVSVYALRRPSLAPAASFARMTVRIVVGILALLTGLQALGVPVTPLLTTLGIGSLAVALAL